MTESDRLNSQEPGVARPLCHEDEISLYDLWAVLARRKWVLVGIALAVFGCALVYALIQDPVYKYSIVVEIGSRIVNEDQRPIESPQTVEAKLNQSYIPAAISEWLHSGDGSVGQPRLQASVPKGSNIVSISGQGTDNRSDDYFELLGTVSLKLQQDHNRVVEVIKSDLGLQVEEARNELASLQDDLGNLRSRQDRLATQEELLKQEMAELEELLSSAEANRQQAANDLSGEAEAMTLLMLSNEIRATRARISEIREQLHITLADQRDTLKSKISEMERAVASQSTKIKILQSKLHNIVETKPITPPQQSLSPTGKGPVMLGGLGMVLGVFLGVFGAFLVEFVGNARRYMRDGDDV